VTSAARRAYRSSPTGDAAFMTEDKTALSQPLTGKIFLTVEHGVYAAIGALLALIAVVAVIQVGIEAGASVLAWSGAAQLFGTVDQLLFVLMLVEILHTVRVSIRSGNLNAEPFLVVGLIASIRRVLVITLQSSNAQHQGSSDHDALFRTSMIELGVLALLILTMVVSIFLIRWSEKLREKPNTY
jgi:uncharacterized membrane protein (DUF373 family)